MIMDGPQMGEDRNSKKSSQTLGERGMEILGHGVYSLPDAAKLTA